MKTGQISGQPGYWRKWSPQLFFTVTLLMVCGLMIASAQAFTLTVMDGSTNPPTPIGVGYRWLVEEDATHQVVPGDSTTNWFDTFHKSYMPVVAKGHSSDALPGLGVGRYYVSVLPDSGYSIGGGQLEGDGDLTVYVQPNPIPTANISVLVFHDNNPINNAPDLPQETPGTGPGQTDMSGFTVKLEDAGGRYGASAGEAFQDAFGNPIGTTYNPDGSVATLGQGFLLTGPDGQVVFQNMAPGKYGVFVIPPAGQGWQQTSTIEGKKLIDAWVKANEPIFFAEFGPPGWHAFVGFTREFTNEAVLNGGSTISGQVVNNHLSRPPDTAFYDGAPFPHTTPWVGLNALGGLGEALYVQRTDNGAFSIPDVPPGNYQLAIFDDNLDLVFNFKGITVNADGSCATPDGSCNVGNVATFDWFSHLWLSVFNDENENGFWDGDEVAIPETATAIKWRDGSLYQGFPTDGEGFAPYDEVFPFFNWLVAEVGFTDKKATGATIVPDAGGAINPLDLWSFDGQLNPQPQPENFGLPYRVENVDTGSVPLTQAFQGFLGQTSVIQFGKTDYGPGADGLYGTPDDENGGISGVVYYSVTRAEDDPELGGPEPWEPGVPGVTVNLYEVTGFDADGKPTTGAQLATTTTDSWDLSLPTNCPGDNDLGDLLVGPNDCFDGMRNWNQVRPGVFDGGYAFDTITVSGTDISPIPSGQYVVEVIPPDGYEIVRSQDRNVDFGDNYIPQPELVPPECVGADYTVPDTFSLFDTGEAPPLAGQTLPTCDRKLVALGGGDNAAADFFIFTEVPIAAHIVGGILDDTSNEFDPNSPQAGEKYAPPWLPVGIYDWTGKLIGSTYSDEYGRYNALVPSTYTQNLPMPSGTSPNMLTTCMNDPAADTVGGYFKPQYSTFCYTFQYMPGTTTYLDTPVVPVAAFAGPDQELLDCEPPDETPNIARVDVTSNGVGGGPYIPTVSVTTGNPANRGVFTNGPHTIVITSIGIGDNGRDYGFGTAAGTVTLGNLNLEAVSSSFNWNNSTITATIPGNTRIGPTGTAGGQQLTVTRGDGLSTVNGVTVQAGLRPGATVQTVVAGGSIQDAIDTAGVNDLILVGPGVYEEFVIMWKPVQLQGWGAGSTEINAVKAIASERLQIWRNDVESLVATGSIDLLPGQEALFGGIEPVTFFTEEGAGVLVAGKSSGNTSFAANPGARIDGISIRGADQGGGIVASGYIDNLEVSNNVLVNNNGLYGGGFRSGHPVLDNALVDSENDNIRVHHNVIAYNGGQGGAGGGVSMYTGSDGYQVTDNFICGNFSLSDGGGIGHLGLSDGGRIANNDILFNETFNQGQTVHGGGIFIAGGGAAAGQLTPGAGNVVVEANRILGNLAGAGDGGGVALVRVNGQDVDARRNQENRWYGVDLFDNIIANNVAALAGGGISLRDTVKANIVHNTVAHNNATATAGNAFSPGQPNFSNPQPAGIVSHAHSPTLNPVVGRAGNSVPDRLKVAFANPLLVDTIVWQNHSAYFFGNPQADPPLYEQVEVDAVAPYWDLAVLPAGTGFLSPTYSVLTSPDAVHFSVDNAGSAVSTTVPNQYAGNGNITSDPLLTDAYFNSSTGLTANAPEPLFTAPAFDEGGNFIQVRFGPLNLVGTDRDTLYHLGAGSPAIDAGTNLSAQFPALSADFDGDARPQGTGVDIGADEATP